MRILACILLALLVASIASNAQNREDAPVPPEPSTLNQTDTRGQRHGMWLTVKEPRMGEPGISEFGNYDHGIKLGIWYKIDNGGELVSIETFRNNVLDGEAKYYDQGRLYCIGHYRGLNPKYKFDTIVVVHPVSQEEVYRVIPTDNGSLRHGNWKYFDPHNGHLIKEEEYQVDELIAKKEYEVSATVDSIYQKRHEALMPHIKNKKPVKPAGKRPVSTLNP